MVVGTFWLYLFWSCLAVAVAVRWMFPKSKHVGVALLVGGVPLSMLLCLVDVLDPHLLQITSPATIASDSSPAPGDPNHGWVSFGIIGRVSNNLVQIENAVLLAKTEGKGVLLPALDWDKDRFSVRFSLGWLQILDLDYLNGLLNPGGPPCLIRGWNVDPDAVAAAYMDTGANAYAPTPTCQLGQVSSSDAPTMLRDPSNWSDSCWVRPFFHMGWLVKDVAQEPSVPASLAYDTDGASVPKGYCSAEYLADADVAHVDAHWLRFFSGQAIYHMYPDLGITFYDTRTDIPRNASFPVTLRYRPEIIETARDVIQQASGGAQQQEHASVLCMHIRRSDFTAIPVIADLDAYLEIALGYLATGTTAVIVLTDGNSDERGRILERIPGVVLGCDPNRFARCASSPVMRIAVEQQVCGMTRHFIGTRGSSFTGRILRIRHDLQMEHRGFALQRSDSPARLARDPDSLMN
ncbi:GDP-fucose protein O-fucosyltransferase [Plasmodiophora brassicae]